MAGGQDALSDHHLHPCGFGEQFVALAAETAIGSKQRDPCGEASGQRHRASLGPEGLRSRIGVIVKDQEVADG